jgi:hypothetical protein
MAIKLTSRNARAAAACAVFTIVCVAMAADGSVSWLWAVGGLLVTAAFAFESVPADVVDELEISDTALTRRYGDAHGAREQESVAWSDVQRIEIHTDDSGLTQGDFYYLVFGKNSTGVVVTEDLARRQHLLAEFERRFPSFDHRAFMEAAASRITSVFTVWERPA